LTDQDEGLHLRCPTCQTEFDAVAEYRQEIAPAEHDTPICCPRCGAVVGRSVEHCPRCPAEFEPWGPEDEARPWIMPSGRLDAEPHRGPTILGLGVGSVLMSVVSLATCCCLLPQILGLGLGTGAIRMGQYDLARIRRGEIEFQGEGPTRTGLILGIIGTILNGLLLLLAGGWYALVAFSDR
jgi:hypothetical protein